MDREQSPETTMTDLRKLARWHDRHSKAWPEQSAHAKKYAETARILSLLLRVREGCYMDKIKDTMDIGTGERNPAIRVTGPVETLRRLAELLEKAK